MHANDCCCSNPLRVNGPAVEFQALSCCAAMLNVAMLPARYAARSMDCLLMVLLVAVANVALLWRFIFWLSILLSNPPISRY